MPHIPYGRQEYPERLASIDLELGKDWDKIGLADFGQLGKSPKWGGDPREDPFGRKWELCPLYPHCGA